MAPNTAEIIDFSQYRAAKEAAACPSCSPAKAPAIGYAPTYWYPFWVFVPVYFYPSPNLS